MFSTSGSRYIQGDVFKTLTNKQTEETSEPTSSPAREYLADMSAVCGRLDMEKCRIVSMISTFNDP